MPYKSNQELPPAVRSALPTQAQNIFREAFNAAEAKTPGDEEGATKIAWGAVKNAGWAKNEAGNWVKTNAEKPKDEKKTPDITREVFSVGKWKGDEYTEADLDDMVKNFAELKGEIRPPLKLGHDESKWRDGLPALGWVTELKREGGKLLATFSDMPTRVYEALKQKRYARVSSEIAWNYKDVAGKLRRRVFTGLALLGADMPAVRNLEDLDAYLYNSPDSGSSDKVRIYNLDEDKQTNTEDKKEMSEDIKKYQDENEALKAELKAFTEKEAERVAKEAADKKAADEVELKAFCESMVEEGKMLPAARDIITSGMDSHTYSEDSGFALTFETFKKYAEIQAKVLDKDEKAKESGDSKDSEYSDLASELDTKTRKYMSDHKVDSYVEAQKAVFTEDTDLANRYEADFFGGND